MPRPPILLRHPCPWCGVAMRVPPAMPEPELARAFESRCRSCRGGVRAQATWRDVLLFVAVYAAVSDLMLWSGMRAWEAWRDQAPIGGDWRIHGGWLALAVGGFVIIAALAQRHLVAATALVRGRPPR